MTEMRFVRPRLDWFVDVMRRQMAARRNQAKADWREQSAEWIRERVSEELAALFISARPLTDREVAKLLCGVLGTAATFGTSAQDLHRALVWCLDHWNDLEGFFVADVRPF